MLKNHYCFTQFKQEAVVTEKIHDFVAIQQEELSCIWPFKKRVAPQNHVLCLCMLRLNETTERGVKWWFSPAKTGATKQDPQFRPLGSLAHLDASWFSPQETNGSKMLTCTALSQSENGTIPALAQICDVSPFLCTLCLKIGYLKIQWCKGHHIHRLPIKYH